MSIIDIEMNKIYGLNKRSEPLCFVSDKKHNFIYGINAIGKSSFSKGIELISQRKQYKKMIETDSNEYSINFNFDNINVLQDNNNSPIVINSEVSKRVFVFTKRYLNQNVSLINSDESNIQIGIQIAEREKNLKKLYTFIEDSQKQIYDKMKNKNIKSTKEYLLDNSYISSIKTTLKDKAKENQIKQNSFEQIINFDINKIDVEGLNSNDFNGKNLKVYSKLSNVLSQLLNSIDNIIAREIDFDYRIFSVEDKEFYEQLLIYLKNKDELPVCPVCLNGDFDLISTIENIDNSIKRILTNEIINSFNCYYSELEIDEDSTLFCNVKEIYNDLLVSEVDVEKIKIFIEKIDEFYENYDSYLLKYIDFSFTNISEYNDTKETINSINQQNAEFSGNDRFIEKLNEMLNYIFENNEYTAEKFKYQEGGNEYYGIQLLINGIMKKGISIEDFWNEVLSESEKTKISIAFMFSIILFNDYDGKIFCVFDDPIDSYDTLNKYKMTRLIYDFIFKKKIFEPYKYDCYDLIFSHSSEYLRLFNENLNSIDEKNVLYWVMSEKNIFEIDTSELYLLRGDYNILCDLLKQSKNNGQPISIEKIIGTLPIIRESAALSHKVFDDDINRINKNNNDIRELDKFLSNNVIHGFSSNILIKNIIDFLKKYIDVNIETRYENEKVFDYIKEYIDNNIENFLDMSFSEQLFFKNILAIYIRAKYDNLLTIAIKSEISKYKDKTLDEIHDELREIAKKIAVLYNDLNTRTKYNDLLKKINTAKPMLNDFAHSANIFLTPLIDVSFNELNRIYQNL